MKRKMVTGILATFVISSICVPFITTTIYTDARPLLFLIFASVFASLFVENKVFRILLQLSVLIVTTYFYADTSDLTTLEWITRFLPKVFDNLLGFIQRTEVTIHYDVGAFLLGFSILLIVDISVKQERWYIPFGLVLTYFLLLVAFNREIIVLPMFQLLCGTVLWRIWILYDLQIFQHWKQSIVMLVLVGIIFASAYNYSIIYREPYNELVSATFDLRTRLSGRGFYDFFSINRVTGMGSTSGYSEDSKILGGPLYLNYSPVFDITQDRPQYLKMNTDTKYTGSGWATFNAMGVRRVDGETFFEDKRVTYSDKAHTVKIMRNYQNVTTVPQVHGKVKLTLLQESSSANYEYLGNLGLVDGTKGINMGGNLDKEQASIEYTQYLPTTTPDDLRKVVESPLVDQRFVELPNTLTDRVRELGNEIVKDTSNQYDAVDAVLRYLKENYKYELLDVQFPQEGADYVEHFLFDMKQGYCEHFSSAAAVILRTQGVQTRWVKGYAPGSVVNLTTNTYQITNADAHAWIEVYFEGHGWVPFEATPGFSGNFLETQQTETPGNTETPTNPGGSSNEKPTSPNAPDKQRPAIKDSTEESEEAVKRINLNRVVFGVISILAVISCVIVLMRKQIYLLYARIMVRFSNKSYQERFSIALRALEMKYKRPIGMGLEAYASQLPEAKQDAYQTARYAYESQVYSEHKTEITIDDETALKDILKR